MQIRIFLILSFIFTLGTIFCISQPNIVILLADDMGYGDVGCYNPDSKIPTPNMNQLAAGGLRFMDAHSPSAVCTPSRYGILTGRYAWRTPLKRSVFSTYEHPLIEQKRLTIASLLKGKQYLTACIGKWHLGLGWQAKDGVDFSFDKPWPWPGGTMDREEEAKIDFRKPIEGGPTELGFDYFFGSSCCPTCNTPYCYVEGNTVVDQPSEYYQGQYLEQRSGFRSKNWNEQEVDTDFTEKSVTFIRKAVAEQRPFLLYLSASAPHEPCEEAVIPSFMRGKSKAGARGDMVALFDWMVGEIRNTLVETGQFDNTLLIVTSDNGAKPGDYNRYTYGHKSCGNLRGFKGGIWEGGHRVPLIVSWPHQIDAGGINHDLVGLQDILATVAEVFDHQLAENAGEDSHSFLGALTETPGYEARENLINHSAMGVFAIRKNVWKLILNSEGSGDYGRGVHGNSGTPPDTTHHSQLYNLLDDPFEQYNLVEMEPEMVTELKALLDRQKTAGSTRDR